MQRSPFLDVFKRNLKKMLIYNRPFYFVPFQLFVCSEEFVLEILGSNGKWHLLEVFL